MSSITTPRQRSTIARENATRVSLGLPPFTIESVEADGEGYILTLVSDDRVECAFHIVTPDGRMAYAS